MGSIVIVVVVGRSYEVSKINKNGIRLDLHTSNIDNVLIRLRYSNAGQE